MKIVALHLIRIVFAYLVSAIFAGVALQAFTVFWTSAAAPSPEQEGMFAPVDAYTLEAGLLIVFMVTIFAAAFAALCVAFAEHFAWRQWWIYAGVAAVTGVGLAALFGMAIEFLVAGALIGVGAGLVYWAIAGRHAGAEDARHRKIIVTIMAATAAILIAMMTYVLFGTYFL